MSVSGQAASPPARCSVGFAEGNLENGVVTAVRDALAGLGTSAPVLAIITACTPQDPETGGRVLGHASALVREIAPDCAVIGATTHGVLAADNGVELAPAVSVWLASWPGPPPRPFRVHARAETTGHPAIHGLPDVLPDDRMAVVLADPHSTPIDDVLAAFDRIDGPLPVVGALVAGGGAEDESRLLLGGSVLTEGAVGVVLGERSPVRAVVSQGCRPIGPALAVTSAHGGYLIEWGGHPALTRCRRIISDLPAEDQALSARGLQMGVAHHPGALGDDASDFVMRSIIGVDPVAGCVTIAADLPVGTLLRLHLRDADSASADLDRAIASVTAQRQPVGAFVLTCAGRGRAMFTTSAHDSAAVVNGFATQGVGGLFAAGEIGPVGGANHVHAFTAVLLVVDPVSHDEPVEVVVASSDLTARDHAAGLNADLGAGLGADLDADLEAELAALLSPEGADPTEPPPRGDDE